MIEKQIAVSTILCQLNKLLTVLPSFTVILWVYKRDIDIFIYNFWSKYDSLKFIQRGSSQDDSSRQEKTILQNQTLKPSSPTDRRLVSLNHLLSTVEPAPFPIPIPTLQHHDDPHLGLVPVLGVGALVVVFPGWRGSWDCLGNSEATRFGLVFLARALDCPLAMTMADGWSLIMMSECVCQAEGASLCCLAVGVEHFARWELWKGGKVI